MSFRKNYLIGKCCLSCPFFFAVKSGLFPLTKDIFIFLDYQKKGNIHDFLFEYAF